MKRLTPKALLTLLFPLAIFFAAGVATAWAWDNGDACETTANPCCCGGKVAGGEGVAPQKSVPVGPCGSPKSACGCDNSTPLPDTGLRVVKPGRISEDPGAAPVQNPQERRAEFAVMASIPLSDKHKTDDAQGRYLLNSSFLC